MNGRWLIATDATTPRRKRVRTARRRMTDWRRGTATRASDARTLSHRLLHAIDAFMRGASKTSASNFATSTLPRIRSAQRAHERPIERCVRVTRFECAPALRLLRSPTSLRLRPAFVAEGRPDVIVDGRQRLQVPIDRAQVALGR